MPPRLAPIGMAIVSATLPFPLAGSDLNTGVRKVSIIAAVAVLEINMEKIPVMSINPNSTFSERLPNGAKMCIRDRIDICLIGLIPFHLCLRWSTDE